jgi:SAM-dependent methyltransferase
MQHESFHGTGPGVQSKDGCSVEVYSKLPYAGDIECLAGWLAPGTSVLELGCGAGRLTRRLLSFGCVVTAVDNSAAMLSRAPFEARLVCADIEGLHLAQTFDVVLLASGLINHCDPLLRAAFVCAAAAHLKPSGQFFLQRQDPAWLASAGVGRAGESAGIDIDVESVERDNGIVRMTVCYIDGSRRWTHSFALVALDEAALQRLLHAAGFGSIVWLDMAQRWASVALAAAG